MNDPGASSRAGHKARLLALLQAGAGSVVVASAVLAAPSAAVASIPRDALMSRAEEARNQLVQSLPPEQSGDKRVQLAWWGNRWGNGGWRPWNNWPNGWHNWNNWGNRMRRRRRRW
jgi:hypothetical protein